MNSIPIFLKNIFLLRIDKNTRNRITKYFLNKWFRMLWFHKLNRIIKTIKKCIKIPIMSKTRNNTIFINILNLKIKMFILLSQIYDLSCFDINLLYICIIFIIGLINTINLLLFLIYVILESIVKTYYLLF